VPAFTAAPPLRVVAHAGSAITLSVAARSKSEAVEIGSLGLPLGAKLQPDPKKPGRAVFSWTTPLSGSYAVTFTARTRRKPQLGVTRTMVLIVRPAPINLDGANHTWYWAYLDTPVNARTRPLRSAHISANLGIRTPEGTSNLVLLTKRLTSADGSVWYQARLPILPNNTTGWIPARALSSPIKVTTHLVINREALTATLYSRGRRIFQAPIGVGTSSAPTPTGEFYVRDLLRNFDNPFYGPAAYGTSARSSVLTDWPDGGHIGIHGTNQPQLIPGHISHGCIRMTNTTILQLVRLMPIGTPITIR
jgi:hypothetical protein